MKFNKLRFNYCHSKYSSASNVEFHWNANWFRLMKNLTIAIDGHASTGKSSIAKELAIKYGYIYINSGSMYRAVTLIYNWE